MKEARKQNGKEGHQRKDVGEPAVLVSMSSKEAAVISTDLGEPCRGEAGRTWSPSSLNEVG